METYWLTCHPETPGKAIKAISAKVSHAVPGELGVWFNLYGVIGQLVWPAWNGGGRVDRLWQSTCLELFIADAEGAGYLEFNLAPSGAWAAYGFTGYREGMHNLHLARPPEADGSSRGTDECQLAARIAVAPIADGRIGLSAVIEELDGTKSYWALAHAPGKPDFHHPACFAAALPAPDTP